MKCSKYNIIYQRENGDKIAYNTYSGVVSKINNEFEEIMNSLDDSEFNNDLYQNNELAKKMKEVGYIIDDIDEFKNINRLSHMQRIDSNKIKLVIATTLECNFACPYCYETPQKGYMSKDVMDKIFSFAIEKIKYYKLDGVSVVWYGGEPLLYPEVIEYLSLKFINYCKENKISYNASIITNGYLINSEIVELMSNAFIGFAQITIDGPEHIHDGRRFLCDPSKTSGTFKTIINNINLLTIKKIKVGIRVNIDSENMNNIYDLIKSLDVLLENKKYIGVYLGHVFEEEINSEPKNTSCISKETFANLKIDLLNNLKAHGFSDVINKNFPKTRLNYCSATFLNSFVFGPTGKIFKCWNDICDDSKTIADINLINNIEHLELKTLMNKWVSFDLRNNAECMQCKFFPICAGGCPRERIDNIESFKCEDIKYNTEKLINFMIDNKLK